MNIHISKHEHEMLLEHKIEEYLIGSHFYNTNIKDSDIDKLMIYDDVIFDEEPIVTKCFPNIHQFQYKDVENNTDYIWTSLQQFWKNLYSGDSTINVEVVLFDENFPNDFNKISFLRTYKIIKSFLGFAKRDLKQSNEGVHKVKHAYKGLYIAECLLYKSLPLKEYIKDIFNDENLLKRKGELSNIHDILRNELNQFYNDGTIPTYYIPKIENSLYKKLIESNNIKEFKYQ